jgi:hypothetical protein
VVGLRGLAFWRYNLFGGNINQRSLSLCGIAAPLLFVFLAILGGAIRPGYSHITDTVSELFSPGSPNKLPLDILYTIFAILLILFGFGIVQLVQKTNTNKRIGMLGASLFIAMGCLNVTTATIFPQDAWGSTPTFAGEMHIRISGFIGLISLFYMLLIGIWFIRTGISSKFGIYSFITIGLVVISAVLYMANTGSPYMGLTERVTILIGFQWTFTLALWMFLRTRKGNTS